MKIEGWCSYCQTKKSWFLQHATWWRARYAWQKQEIDDIAKIEDIFVDDYLFRDTDTEDVCNLVDQIKSETDANHILLEHEPVDTTPDIPRSPEPLLNFSDILLKNNKGKNRTAKKNRQKYKNIRPNQDKIKKLTKQAIKEIKKSDYLETDDVETVNYNDGINIDDISTAGDVEIENMSDPETIAYDKVNKDIT